MTRETICEYSGMIIGYLDKENNGDITVKLFSGKIIGYYRANRNVTTDFSSHIFSHPLRAEERQLLLFFSL